MSVGSGDVFNAQERAVHQVNTCRRTLEVGPAERTVVLVPAFSKFVIQLGKL
jgi:hypothetical protein